MISSDGGESDGEAEMSPRDPNQESDLWWGAYAGRTMAPTFGLCAMLSVLVSVFVVWIWHSEKLSKLYPSDENGNYDAQLLWHLGVLAILALWFLPLLTWTHRVLSRNYRLTSRNLYRDSGFHHPSAGQVELAKISRVEVSYAPMERLLRVGSITLSSEGGERLILEGVPEPEAVAALIRESVDRVRRGSP